jgi:hypothetical protein
VSFKRYFEQVNLVSILNSKCILKGIILCFFQVPYERTQKPWKDSSQRFHNNQVGDKVIIWVQDSIWIGDMAPKEHIIRVSNYKSKLCIKWCVWNHTHAFLLRTLLIQLTICSQNNPMFLQCLWLVPDHSYSLPTMNVIHTNSFDDKKKPWQ